MAKAILGERVGKDGVLRPIATAVIFDDDRQKVLLTRRSDNGRWCLPGGAMDPGESAEQACVREVDEETGLVVRAARLIGIYTSPDLLIEYPDGNRIQPVVFCFEANVVGGELQTTEETTEAGYFKAEEIQTLDILEFGRQQIWDAMQNHEAAFIK